MHDDSKSSEEALTHSVNELDKDIKVLDEDIKSLNRSNRHWPTFGRGIIGSLGAVIGATIVIAIILYILQRLAVLPVIGDIFKLALDQLKQGKTP